MGLHFTVSGLATIIPDGKHAINTSLNKLIDMGYVTKEQGRSEAGKFSEINLEVHEIPVKPMTEKPMSGNQLPEKPEAEEPIPGNHEQLNNNGVNSNKCRKSDKKNKFNNFDQRDYGDMTELERLLIE